MYTGRPLSPHLTWYRFPLPAITSVTHRATGIVLSVGTVALAWWICAVAMGGRAFAVTQDVLGSWLGILALFGWSVAFFYHLSNGIRHLAFDLGLGFDLPKAYATGYAVFAATAALTIVTWLIVLLG
ncbi:succinate dehydrogenase, cytochrome b556 subunit [uncultured Methylobacterium sp.]|mgnify:CR=1 FL=1|jgi:succinate dehydrogenase / fumarate reductase cytochrome b subunit|uniref:succinate dehydrogenase, cytochrome b556 subunit n=1 Tax=uncultured Methylobacterium sp. TaxID=157278 RepID=UPI002629844E|nr:succinate dehydrogenase, cytochrome b556 subunit [uncultured Methylobacterium sp.]